ncbi:tryptophan synthase subunit alpha, partial [Staphylococcus aureus]|uniref:tryptophan synthase subunit alpha n=1 Tax=Staphylococcus aureus TaxID=1280 RepID=UPI001E49BDBF
GIPYSDPVMDGPVIQRATTTALAGGVRIADAFDVVHRVTSAVSAPALVMTYYNPVFHHGVERFAQELAAADGAGLIAPD